MPKNKALKIVVDTNLWISFLISDRLNIFDSLIFSRKIKFAFSKELFDEIRQTIQKPKLKKYFAENNVFEKMLSVIEPFANLVEVTSTINICKDPNDDFLLALAKDSNADYLLTGDKDLLELKTFGKTKITTVSDFLTGILNDLKMKN